LKESRYRGHVV